MLWVHKSSTVSALLLLAGIIRPLSAPADEPAKPVDFSREIRPILSDACFACHGPDAESRKADLRLDIKEGAFADLSGYQAIVPGDPDDSELYLRISEESKSMRMPPQRAERQLTPEEIETIRLWIEQGAVWQQHWSFVRPPRSQ